MNRKKAVLIAMVALLVCVAGAFVLLSPASAQRGKASEIKITTGDLTTPYEVLGPVNYKTGSTSIDDVNGGLLKEAQKLAGTQYIIGVNYFSHAGSIYGYGTAVKPR